MFRKFENRVLGRRVDPNMEEVTRGWNKISNKEVHNL
jgi:hypothetical protein